MKEKIFISGSISIKNLDEKIKQSLMNIQNKNYNVLVGDAEGIDKLIQDFFSRNYYFNLIVYHIYNIRNLQNDKFQTRRVKVDKELENKKNNERQKQTCKDKQMAMDCDMLYCIWDGKSNGTYNNMCEAIKLGKAVKLYLADTKEERFFSEDELQDLKVLIDDRYMSNNGVSLKEIYAKIMDNCQRFNIKNYKSFTEFLENKNLIHKANIGTKQVYAPMEDKYAIKKLYKGSISSYSFTKEFDEMVQSMFIDDSKLHQNALFD